MIKILLVIIILLVAPGNISAGESRQPAPAPNQSASAKPSFTREQLVGTWVFNISIGTNAEVSETVFRADGTFLRSIRTTATQNGNKRENTLKYEGQWILNIDELTLTPVSSEPAFYALRRGPIKTRILELNAETLVHVDAAIPPEDKDLIDVRKTTEMRTKL